ncbi:ABC transporter permease [Neobacillus sp. D3-1R]|uniref:ABC transporter permease n=1 Tax=Neobacillus sp. D3-1R TaxID=3445778 RepID=UPI003F9F4B6E
MLDVRELWTKRSKKTGKEISRYLRYIFNGHLMIVLIFIIGSLTFYYQQWVKSLDDQFPAAMIMSVILSILLTYSPIYTFLLEADRVFLIPVETRLKNYFLKSGIVSFILQAYIIVMVLAALMPIYVQVYGSSFKDFFYFLICCLLLKIWNLALKWKVQFYVEKQVQFIDSFVRFSLNTVFVYLLFMSANKTLLGFLVVVMLGLFLFFQQTTKKKGLKWEEIISLEQDRLTHFYRIANLFTDVPKLRDVVKRRKWLDWLTTKIIFDNKNTQFYLLTRTFLRSGDYFGLVVRLTVIGSLLIYFWDFVYGQFLFLLLFMYLTGFQLLPLKKHHQNILWLDLYPIHERQRSLAFQKIISIVLTIQGLVFAGVFLVKGEWLYTLLGILLGLTFSKLFVRFYSWKKV